MREGREQKTEKRDRGDEGQYQVCVLRRDGYLLAYIIIFSPLNRFGLVFVFKVMSIKI